MQQVGATFAAALAILDPPAPFALAVSGGPDSVALMRLAASLKPIVFTVDHGLRAASADEAKLVRGWAAESGFRHETLRWAGEKPRAGLQAAAREARYRRLAEACIAAGVGTLMTGHTLDDQIETVAMRRAKGSGPVGLAGMPSQTILPGTNGKVLLARPLIATRKAALVAMLEAMGQDFVTDPSNSDPRFDRGRMRAGAAPDVTVDEVADAQRGRLRLETEAQQFLRGCTIGDRTATAPRLALAELDPALGDVVLAALLRRVGGRGLPGSSLERARVLEAISSPGPFQGRTLADTILRPATRAEAGRVEAIAFEPERKDGTLGAGWWLPFAQYRQIGPDGLRLTPPA